MSKFWIPITQIYLFILLIPYRTESFVGTPTYKTHMRLTIFNIQHDDYGTYKCVAKNPRGETDGIIRLYSKYLLQIFFINIPFYNNIWE